MLQTARPLAAVALALGVLLAGPATAAPAEPAFTVANIPAVFTSRVTPGDAAARCDAALEAVAIGRPVSFAAMDCLRVFLLEADPEAPAVAQPTPDACEALLPALATGTPVPLGVAVPCIETYILGTGQVAAR